MRSSPRKVCEAKRYGHKCRELMDRTIVRRPLRRLTSRRWTKIARWEWAWLRVWLRVLVVRLQVPPHRRSGSGSCHAVAAEAFYLVLDETSKTPGKGLGAARKLHLEHRQ